MPELVFEPFTDETTPELNEACVQLMQSFFRDYMHKQNHRHHYVFSGSAFIFGPIAVWMKDWNVTRLEQSKRNGRTLFSREDGYSVYYRHPKVVFAALRCAEIRLRNAPCS